MEKELPFFNWSLKKLLLTEPDSFNRSRIKIIYSIFLMAILKVIVLIPVAYYYNQEFQVVRGILIMLFYVSLLKVMLWSKSYLKLFSHLILIGGIILIWTNIFISVGTVNLIVFQIVVMIIMCGFYLLDNRFGVIYSIFCSLPVIVHMLVYDSGHTMLITNNLELASPGFEIIVVLNFVTLAMAHFLFHQAFNDNLREKSILNQELHQAVQEANRAAKSKSDFLSTMSHELRTPLNSVIGMTELLMDNPHDDDQKENLEILSFSAVSLHSLINDVLDYNKIDSGKLHLEATRVNLAELIESICAGLRLQAKEKGLSLTLNLDEKITGQNVITDPTRITQIIYNLVGNGVKFTKKGGVTVSLIVLDMSKEDILIRFSIADTGIGISPDKHETIFEPFIQASGNTTRNFGGTGLGLAIVRRLLNLFNSTIYLESSLNKESNFFFDISFKRATQDESYNNLPAESVYDLKGLKVLVAEDNPINVLLLKKIFAKWNVEPVFAENGLIAIEKVISDDFEVVLMDIHMPLMDGYQAATEIRNLADPVKSSICIIALTASISNLENRIKEVGMNDYIYKPFNSKELYGKLKKIHSGLV